MSSPQHLSTRPVAGSTELSSAARTSSPNPSKRLPGAGARSLDPERDAPSRRRRRRSAQRCSALLASLFLGTTAAQCAPITTNVATPADAPAVAVAVTAPVDVEPAPSVSVATTITTPLVTPEPAAAVEPVAVTTAAQQSATVIPAISGMPAYTPPAEPVRIPGPEGTSEQGRCTQYEDLLMIYAPEVGWDALRMSKLAWRESNCFADIRSKTSDTGLLQINDIGLPFLNEALGEPVDRWTLTDPVQNIRAAAALCTFWATNGRSCYQPWSRN